LSQGQEGPDEAASGGKHAITARSKPEPGKDLLILMIIIGHVTLSQFFPSRASDHGRGEEASSMISTPRWHDLLKL
jgi:hypothetical protein